MKVKMQMKLQVEYSLVFDDTPLEIKDYLTGISRSMLLEIASFFLGFENRNSKYNDLKEFFSNYFRQENSLFANKIYLKLKNVSNEKNAELNIINHQTSLQLFEFCFDNLTEENTQTGAEAEVNIFKAYLALVEQNKYKEEISSLSIKNLPIELQFAGISLAQSFPYSDLLNYDKIEVFVCQIIKSVYLFEYLESNQRTKPLLAHFLQYFKSSDWKSFLKELIPLAYFVISAKNEAQININITEGDTYLRGCELLDSLIITDSEIVQDYDFRKLRSSPFYKISDGHYRIIFGLFVLELLHKGLYFKLNEFNRKLEKNCQIKDFRSDYCNNFSEKFLMYRILNSIYQNRYIEFSGEQISALGIEGEPDYYIRKGNNLFLFEAKDILINAEIKTSYDFAKYETELKKKLYLKDENGKITSKAILQLTKNIERALTTQFSFDKNYKIKSIKIYPIIIVFDNQFNTVGINLFLNEWFTSELSKIKERGINIDRVNPIVIIGIDTFIFNQDYFRDRVLKLEDLLNNYIKFVTFDKKKKYKDKEHVNLYASRTILPFSTFIADVLYQKNLRGIPKMLKEKGYSLFK